MGNEIDDEDDKDDKDDKDNKDDKDDKDDKEGNAVSVQPNLLLPFVMLTAILALF